jgi:hypothetical protein
MMVMIVVIVANAGGVGVGASKCAHPHTCQEPSWFRHVQWYHTASTPTNYGVRSTIFVHQDMLDIKKAEILGEESLSFLTSFLG